MEQASKDGEQVAKILETYYNEQEKKIKANIHQINSCLWIDLFEHLLLRWIGIIINIYSRSQHRKLRLEHILCNERYK